MPAVARASQGRRPVVLFPSVRLFGACLQLPSPRRAGAWPPRHFFDEFQRVLRRHVAAETGSMVRFPADGAPFLREAALAAILIFLLCMALVLVNSAPAEQSTAVEARRILGASHFYSGATGQEWLCAELVGLVGKHSR